MRALLQLVLPLLSLVGAVAVLSLPHPLSPWVIVLAIVAAVATYIAGLFAFGRID